MIRLLEVFAIIALAAVAGVLLANGSVAPAVISLVAATIFAIPKLDRY